MIVIEILLLFNWELMSGYAVVPVVKKLEGRTAMPDDDRPIAAATSFLTVSRYLPNPSPKSDIISRTTHDALMNETVRRGSPRLVSEIRFLPSRSDPVLGESPRESRERSRARFEGRRSRKTTIAR
jgi:hypothetical protein